MIEVRDLSRSGSAALRDERVTAVDSGPVHHAPGRKCSVCSAPMGLAKTTTLRMLCTVLTPSAGTATVADFDVVKQAGRGAAARRLPLGQHRRV